MANFKPIRFLQNDGHVADRRILNFLDSPQITFDVQDDGPNVEFSAAWDNAALFDAIVGLVVNPMFGNGADGNVTLGSNTTLARDMQYNILDMAGFDMDTAGCRVRCRFLRNTGAACTLGVVGRNAVNRIGGISTGQLSLGGGSGGGNGGLNTANGSVGSTRNNSYPVAIGGGSTSDGGSGGASSGNSPGAGGDATAVTIVSNGYGGLHWLDTATMPASSLQIHGGAGGGGGGSTTGGSNGGGGGGGGGVACVWAHTVEASASTILISASGGNGGNGAVDGGGGGGGGGGYARLVYAIAGGTLPTVVAAAGAAGVGAGGGAAGVAGNAGRAQTYRLGV